MKISWRFAITGLQTISYSKMSPQLWKWDNRILFTIFPWSKGRILRLVRLELILYMEHGRNNTMLTGWRLIWVFVLNIEREWESSKEGWFPRLFSSPLCPEVVSFVEVWREPRKSGTIYGTAIPYYYITYTIPQNQSPAQIFRCLSWTHQRASGQSIIHADVKWMFGF